MNSFWRITRGELDKIFVRPAIFIMTGFFVLAIVVSVLMFDPAPRNDLMNLANIQGESVTEVYQNFNNNQNKLVFDSNFDNINDMINFYNGTDNTVVGKQQLITNFDNVLSIFEEYSTSIESENNDINNIISLKNDLRNSILVLMSSYSSINENFLTMLITNENNENTLRMLNQLNNEASTSGDERDIEHHQRIVNNINQQGYLTTLQTLFDSIVQVEVSTELLNSLYNNYYVIAEQRLDDITSEMVSIYNSALTNSEINFSDESINNIKTLADNYKLHIDEVNIIITNNIMLNIVGDLSTSSLDNYTFADLQDFNKYQAKEELTKNVYLFETNTYSYEYANVFQSNVNSNENTNAYDFMYYALEFLSFIIVIYCVIIGSGMISGETSGGTMKMLAIRPYRRNKIITGKLTATFLLGVIFLIIGTLTTFIIGARLYGLSSLPILMIFNAETASVISAPALFFIFLALLLVRIIVYTILAVFISTAFKSNIAAVIISVMIYIFVALFGNLFGDSPVYGYLPFANVDLFRFFGGEFLANNGNVLGLDFSCPIQPDLNFYISLIIVLVFVAILIAATYIIFKKRDIE